LLKRELFVLSDHQLA